MQNKPIILIVDDIASNIQILANILKDMYNIKVATNGENAIAIASKEPKPDLVLLDVIMPEMDGYEVCKQLKNDNHTKDIPIIFVTANNETVDEENGFNLGAVDYITKPVNPAIVKVRVKTQITIKQQQDELKLLASTDSMTKLYNRRYFSKIAEQSLELAKRENNELSIIMLDIDKFKNVNDTYGHQVGDDVIIQLARNIMHAQRKSDISSRYGGEEFVLLLPNTNIDGAKILAEKLRQIVELSEIKFNETQILKYTISLGLASIDITNDKNIETALKKADDALYEAKENGRNQVVAYIDLI